MRVLRMIAITGFGVLAAGCDSAVEEDATCNKLCVELVETCEFAAYPSFDSCMAGCAYDRDQGADVDHEGVCVTQAACNESTIIECSHQYGVDGTKVKDTK